MADFLQAVDTDGGKQEPSPVTLVSGGVEIGTPASPFTMSPGGLPYTDVSVASLSAGQAAGTALVQPANPTRKGLAIVPNADGRLYYTGSATADGVYHSLYAGVHKVLTGPDCPTGAIYVTGQVASTKLRMGEAS